MNKNLDMNRPGTSQRNGPAEGERGRTRGSQQLDKPEREDRETFNMYWPVSRKRNVRLAADYRHKSPSDYIWDIIRGPVARDLEEMLKELSEDETLREDGLLEN